MNHHKTYTTQEMSAMTGVTISTLRYYERIGLLDRVDRLDNGHRRYDDKDVLRVNFLKRLRATGMRISEMQYYVDLFRQGDSTLVERRKMLEGHRESVLRQMDTLQETLDLLDFKIERYQQLEADQTRLHDTELIITEQSGD